MAIMDPPTWVQRPIFLECAEQQGRQGHGQDLVRDAVNLPQRLDEGRRHSA